MPLFFTALLAQIYVGWGSSMSQCLQRQRIVKYLQDQYETQPETLWPRYPNHSVFRHPASRKWYAIAMNIPQNKLGMEGERSVDILNVKCSPMMLGSLLCEKGFFPAYHMNKKSWISILLDESVADETIFFLLEMSYDSTVPKRKT